MARRDKPLTRDEIEDRLEEAALTLRRSPSPTGSGPKAYGSSWPEFVREWRHAYGYHEATMKVIPNAAEIQRMEDALEWLRLLDGAGDEQRAADDRRIVWMRADGFRWRQIQKRVGLSRSQCWRRWASALITLERRLANQARGRRVAGNPDLLTAAAAGSE